MLNPFPQLLVFSFFAPTLLRAAVAIMLFYLAYQQWQRRDAIARVRSAGFPAVSIAFNTIIGAGLLLGYYTQAAALLAVIGFGIGLWMNKRHPSVRILPNTTILILIIVCLSLLVSGAGALAFDLPL